MNNKNQININHKFHQLKKSNVKNNFMAHTADYGLVQYIPMIFQYSKILRYLFFQHFMAHWQQWFHDPCLASAATKYTAQQETTTTDMTTEIMTEIKTETTTKIRLTNKDPIVGLGDNAYGAAAAKHYVSTRWTKYLPYK